MTAVDATRLEELREALAVALQGQYGYAKPWSRLDEIAREGWRRDAQDVMESALPALLAAARARGELTEAVRALAEELQGTAEITGGKVNGYVFAARLRSLIAADGGTE